MPDINPIITYVIENGGVWAIFVLLLGWIAWKLYNRNLELDAQKNKLQAEASAHVERLYQGRIEAETRIGTALSESSHAMQAVSESAAELRSVVHNVAETVRDLKAISQQNQEIGKELRAHMNDRRNL